MSPIKKKVLIIEVFKLGLLIIVVSGVFAGRIDPILAGKVLGVAGLLYGAYFFYRSLHQKEHGNVLLRLQGDDRTIPTTKRHRVMNMILATGMMVCGFALLLIVRRALIP
jgi:hypothetical protein